MKKKIIAGIVIVAAIAGFFYYRSQGNEEVVPTETVRRGSVSETVSVTGDLVPVEYADLSFRGAGSIDHVFVKEGDAVKQGQSLASLDRTVLQSQLNEARVALQIAVENERLARHGWDDLKKEERNAQKLATEQARENVRTAAAQMSERVLVSPFDGFISKADIRVGETVTLGEAVLRVVRSKDLVIEARVPESDIVGIRSGMRGKATFDSLTSSEVSDTEVTEIDPAATVVQDVVSYVVKFRLIQADERLKEGMTADIDIITSEKKDVLIVPFRSLTKESGKTYAQAKRPDGTFERVEVAVGLEGDEGMVEIRSGLKEGDEVALIARQQ